MQFVDTHSHIYGSEFSDDVDAVVQRAKEAGVGKVFLPNINEDTIEPMLGLCRRYPGYAYPMMGLHPTDIPTDYQPVLNRMKALLSQPNHPFIAVGEVGLDYYWDRTFYEEQQIVFEQQIEWAAEFNLPLMIHSRSAHRELVDIMERHRDKHLRGVFHCFGGTSDEAEELLSFEGFVLGIGGVVTYKKSTLPQVLQNVPLQRIVLETDSPYLPPVPHRGERNESAFSLDTLCFLAHVYCCSEEEVANETNINVKRVFESQNVHFWD